MINLLSCANSTSNKMEGSAVILMSLKKKEGARQTAYMAISIGITSTTHGELSLACTLMALMPISWALRRLSTSLVSTMMGMPGTRAIYQAAATLIARSFLSLGLSLTSALTYVSLQQPRPGHFLSLGLSITSAVMYQAAAMQIALSFLPLGL